ncbi:Glucose/arabinose dehydrogenase, beta-propeller fold [Haloplanus vescus]|uniref:Glucose/arabinose dehydrogenase, beta-propeller fold n=1 Tax=Haloplanus vescus TaxID=555874 RepID=A0A1H4AS06_9EURY|nr:PQQ-dependent sugar dehydrogenase [Haloplanus vescus]SEA38651.1 Glucose/arabinose dehydrogenase, beta-propeller fold [Haloplanus vescus]
MDRRRYLATLGVAAVAGCAGESEDGEPTTTPQSTSGDPTAEVLATDLEIPWGAAYRDGTLYLTERPGRIVRVAVGTVEPVVESVAGVRHAGEGGLLGLAFHPTDPVAYTYQTYEADDGLANRLVRHDLTDDWAPESLLTGIPGAHIHDGGRVFAHDNSLFVTAGDASVADQAQDRDVLAGSVLRVTFDGDPHPDNPFDSPVFSYGHRNPQGLAVRDGDLYSTEHGPQVADEINVLKPGRNYGWPEARGPSSNARFTDPVTSYSPTIAPASATVYDGPIEAWQGDFFFGTLKAEHIHRVTFGDGPDGPTVAAEERLFDGEFGRIRTVFTGPDGHLHAVTSNRDGRGSPVDADDRLIRFTP